MRPSRWPRQAAIFLIELYRMWVSPLRLPTCRFEPTCSAYAVAALRRYGVFGGGWLAVVRLLKCGPWHKPAYDPVPERWHVLGSHPPEPTRQGDDEPPVAEKNRMVA